jgi:glycerol-3-phosphate dehydrogenase subunit B
MSYDTVVVGAGLAGLCAALRLAEQGQRVLIVARGVGATHLAPATVDVLGYLGDERVESPADSIRKLLERAPGHPYGHVSRDILGASLGWFSERVVHMGYAGSLQENLLLPTAVGVAKPSALAARTLLGGDLRAGGRFVFVGFRGFKDFHPSLLADNLMHARLPLPLTARALELDPPAHLAGDLSGRMLADQFDNHDLSDWLVRSLDHRVEPDERVGFPAVLGVRRVDQTWRDLESGLQRRVFEVSTLPPSVPGMRLFDALTTALRAAGARLVIGANVVGAKAHDGQIEAVEVASAAGTVSHPARSVVLASGGFASGGLELDSRGVTRETVFDLPVAGVPDTQRPHFVPEYFDAQPLDAAGVAVDELLRPVDSNERPVYMNLHAAGAILAGAVPWKEKSGTGISVATGYAAAQAILAPNAVAVVEPIR